MRSLETETHVLDPFFFGLGDENGVLGEGLDSAWKGAWRKNEVLGSAFEIPKPTFRPCLFLKLGLENKVLYDSLDTAWIQLHPRWDSPQSESDRGGYNLDFDPQHKHGSN